MSVPVVAKGASVGLRGRAGGAGVGMQIDGQGPGGRFHEGH